MATEGLFWEDLEVGRRWRSESRTVRDGDVRAFADVSGDRNPLHLDAAYARGTVFGRTVAHGVLGLAVATGLLNRMRLTAGTLVALVGVEWDFRRPLLPGAAVTLDVEVESRRETRDAGRGLVVLAASLSDEAGAEIQAGRLRMLVRRRPGA